MLLELFLCRKEQNLIVNQHTKTQDSVAMCDSMHGFGDSFKVLGLTKNLDMHELWHVLPIRVTIFGGDI
jgi:hypothetical protein